LRNGQGQVVRYRNPLLWDGVATAIVRQGHPGTTGNRPVPRYRHRARPDRVPPPSAGALFSGPRQILDLPDEANTAAGMAFRRPMLRAAATAYRAHRDQWLDLDPAKLAHELQTVPRIGGPRSQLSRRSRRRDW
jgi:DNA-3-methyladenine glycosylase II